jgi:hypothetical protein
MVAEVNPCRNALQRVQLEFDAALVGQGRQLEFSYLWLTGLVEIMAIMSNHRHVQPVNWREGCGSAVMGGANPTPSKPPRL